MTQKTKRRNGIRNKRIKNIYYEMKKRCYNPNNKDYKWYGAKGIKICQEWLENPYKFEELILMVITAPKTVAGLPDPKTQKDLHHAIILPLMMLLNA